ncbi:hypothetical protein [Streptosporangium sp. NBC_01469]|uniref:hypothetical protein n=1 Tax=Streptosporangium sp. NBC_01469 TaxID=2903898 RepID=UPI002E2DC4AC|nr:hypothetical protein [Streptosporangium sp. NBC_01469]
MITASVAIGVFGAGAGLGTVIAIRPDPGEGQVMRLAAGTYLLDDQAGAWTSSGAPGGDQPLPLSGADAGSTIADGAKPAAAAGDQRVCLTTTTDGHAIGGAGEGCVALPVLGVAAAAGALVQRPGNPKSTPTPPSAPKTNAPTKPATTKKADPPAQPAPPAPAPVQPAPNPGPAQPPPVNNQPVNPPAPPPPTPTKKISGNVSESENESGSVIERPAEKKIEVVAPPKPAPEAGGTRSSGPSRPSQPSQPQPSGGNGRSQPPATNGDRQPQPQPTGGNGQQPPDGNRDRNGQQPSEGNRDRNRQQPPEGNRDRNRQPQPTGGLKPPQTQPTGGNGQQQPRPTGDVRPPQPGDNARNPRPTGTLRPAVRSGTGRPIVPSGEIILPTAPPETRPTGDPGTPSTAPTARNGNPGPVQPPGGHKRTQAPSPSRSLPSAGPSRPVQPRPSVGPGENTSQGPDGTVLMPATPQLPGGGPDGGVSLPVFENPELLRRAYEALGLDRGMRYTDENGVWDLNIAPPGTPPCRNYTTEEIQALSATSGPSPSQGGQATIPRDSCLWPAFIRWLYAEPAAGQISNWTKFTGLPQRNLELVVTDPPPVPLPSPIPSESTLPQPDQVQPDQGQPDQRQGVPGQEEPWQPDTGGLNPAQQPVPEDAVAPRDPGGSGDDVPEQWPGENTAPFQSDQGRTDQGQVEPDPVEYDGR